MWVGNSEDDNKNLQAMKLMPPIDLGKIFHPLKYRHLALFNESVGHMGVAFMFMN